MGGYFTTWGGRMLNPDTPVGRLGLGPTVKVVFHGRVKGWRGVRVRGERTCATCFMPCCWGTRTLAAGVGRVLWGGDYSQGGGQGKGGVGPNGRDPSYRRGRLGRAGLKVEARRFLERWLVASAPQRVRRRRWDPAGEGP